MARILVVEDDVLLRYILAEWLRTDGFDVVEAASADDAVSVLSSVIGVDLVITDVEMPGSIDGIELADHIRETSLALPVIAVSGAALSNRLPIATVAAYFPKPYELARLSECIVSLLGSAKVPAEERKEAFGHE
jgi:two-component system, response regulator PdtaR